jgi:hypothetical protein
MLGSLGEAVSAQPAGIVAKLPCHMIAGQADRDSKPMAPYKGLKTDCASQTGCVTINGMMAQPVGQIDTQYIATADYLPVVDALPSFILVPEPLPPRTI